MNITIYSTTICAACHTLTQWLDRQDIAYEKKITDADPAAMMEFMAVNDGMIGVPFSVVTAEDGTVTKIPGFDQAKFKQALGL
ncbi:MAG: glutaredoxin [Candidatus Saccharibacteria bacterium]|nr:glutaredoxin [Candidatus Saccharibacteria bacterium]